MPLEWHREHSPGLFPLCVQVSWSWAHILLGHALSSKPALWQSGANDCVLLEPAHTYCRVSALPRLEEVRPFSLSPVLVGVGYIFSPLFSKLIESGGEAIIKQSSGFGTITLDDALHNLQQTCPYDHEIQIQFCFPPGRGLRVTFKPVRWVQHVKTLVPRESGSPFGVRPKVFEQIMRQAATLKPSVLANLCKLWFVPLVFCPTWPVFLWSIKTLDS